MVDSVLAGKTALVTGAAKRLGMHCALALADRGANVVVHYGASASEAEVLCADLADRGVKAWSLQADLQDAAEAEALFDQALRLAGPVHILVNNASIFEPGGLSEVSLEEVSRNTVVNAWAPFVLARAFARQGLEGRIVNLLDTRVAGYDFSHVGYILSKHVLAVLTRMTALEYAPLVTVNAVAPGLILPPPGRDATYLEALAGTVPLQRHGGAEDIVRAMLFLIESPFITGQTVFVDGGAHLKGA